MGYPEAERILLPLDFDWFCVTELANLSLDTMSSVVQLIIHIHPLPPKQKISLVTARISSL